MIKERVLKSANNVQNDEFIIEKMKGNIFNKIDEADERTELGDEEDEENNEEAIELDDEEDFDGIEELD